MEPFLYICWSMKAHQIRRFCLLQSNVCGVFHFHGFKSIIHEPCRDGNYVIRIIFIYNIIIVGIGTCKSCSLKIDKYGIFEWNGHLVAFNIYFYLNVRFESCSKFPLFSIRFFFFIVCQGVLMWRVRKSAYKNHNWIYKYQSQPSGVLHIMSMSRCWKCLE